MPTTVQTLALALIATLAAAAAPSPASADDGNPPSPSTSPANAVPLPDRFTVCFFLGYVTDNLPTNPAVFESLVTNLAASGFTVVHGTYADWRVEACRRHGLRFMIDMVTPELDFRKDPSKAEALCRKLRGDPAVWGYALWYADNCNAQFNPVLEKFRAWDSTHPCFVGAKYCAGIEELTVNPGVLAWEDLDWYEPQQRHFTDLMKMFRCNRKLGAQTGRWIVMAGKDKDRYTINQSIAAGLKNLMWFIGGPWDRKNETWVPDHYTLDLNRELRPMHAELMTIGQPLAVYSTPVSCTASNTPTPKRIPEALVPVPADFWLGVDRGEALLGIYRCADGADAVYAANHNAFAAQDMAMTLKPGKDRAMPNVRIFDVAAGDWRPLERRDGTIGFTLPPGGGALLRFDPPPRPPPASRPARTATEKKD